MHEHAHQTGHIHRGLRPRGDRQPRLLGRLLQLFHTENASDRQQRRSEFVLRLVSTHKDAMDTRKCIVRHYCPRDRIPGGDREGSRGGLGSYEYFPNPPKSVLIIQDVNTPFPRVLALQCHLISANDCACTW